MGGAPVVAQTPRVLLEHVPRPCSCETLCFYKDSILRWDGRSRPWLRPGLRLRARPLLRVERPIVVIHDARACIERFLPPWWQWPCIHVCRYVK